MQKQLHYASSLSLPLSVSGVYPGVIMTVLLRRKISYHLLQTYLPSGLFVIVAWLSLFLPPESIPGRITIAMTTLLTLAAMFGAVRSVLSEGRGLTGGGPTDRHWVDTDLSHPTDSLGLLWLNGKDSFAEDVTSLIRLCVHLSSTHR